MGGLGHRGRTLWPLAIAALSAGLLGALALGSVTRLTPGRFPAVRTVDARFQSYNVELAEVMGATFWKPYAHLGSPVRSVSLRSLEIGVDPELFEPRPPIDLQAPRLRRLAAALAPAYVRVSGSWANSAWFAGAAELPAAPPAGFRSVFTGAQWASVIEFSRAVDARLVTSFAISAGVREGAGGWTPDQARALVEATTALGGEIAAAELFNEPNFPRQGGAPAGYSPATFARDEAAFRAFIARATPRTRIAGPGSVGEGLSWLPLPASSLSTRKLLAAEPPPRFDVFSYHFYGALSQRCDGLARGLGTSAAEALSEQWLARTDRAFDFYARLRDRFAPGAPIWLTETAESACGGNPWASTFLDSFRYLDQLGRLARRGVDAVFHNTLAASEYGLLEQGTFTPRPDYWAALLWHRLMGPEVLDPGKAPSGVQLYAHCLPGGPGGVTVLAIHLDTEAARTLAVEGASEGYTLHASALESRAVMLNGRVLSLGPGDELPDATPERRPEGAIELPPASITFLAFPDAANPACGGPR